MDSRTVQHVYFYILSKSVSTDLLVPGGWWVVLESHFSVPHSTKEAEKQIILFVCEMFVDVFIPTQI